MASRRIKKKKSQAQIAYEKERRRVQQFIYRARKRGYSFPEDIIPQKPKRITQASVRRLQKLKPETLYKKATYGGEATYGEIVSGTEGRKAEKEATKAKAQASRKRKKTARKEGVKKEKIDNEISFTPPAPKVNVYSSAFSEAVIANYKAHIAQFNPHAQSLLNSWLNRIISAHGVDDTAQMLEDAANAGLLLNYQIVYDDKKLAQYMADMMDYLPEAGELFKEEMAEAMEEEEDFSLPI